MNCLSNSEFHTLIEKIRRRPDETVSGQWFNVITYGTCSFIQGNIINDDASSGIMRNIASLVDIVLIDDIAGFWPEIQGHPITITEESTLIDYLSSRGAHEVELIVPERNRARPVDWDRFDETTEYKMYKEHIYPAIMDTIVDITYDRGMNDLPSGHVGSVELEKNALRLLDMGCGSGNLIEDINARFRLGSGEKQGGCIDGGALAEVSKKRLPVFECYGVDINPANVDAAEEKHLKNIFLGDCEHIDGIFPPDLNFDIIIFSGLLNRQVTDRDKAFRILDKTLKKLKHGGFVIITGYTSCHLTAENLTHMGIDVLKKCIPGNLFKDYFDYYLRQLYLGRKVD